MSKDGGERIRVIPTARGSHDEEVPAWYKRRLFQEVHIPVGEADGRPIAAACEVPVKISPDAPCWLRDGFPLFDDVAVQAVAGLQGAKGQEAVVLGRGADRGVCVGCVDCMGYVSEFRRNLLKIRDSQQNRGSSLRRKRRVKILLWQVDRGRQAANLRPLFL